MRKAVLIALAALMAVTAVTAQRRWRSRAPSGGNAPLARNAAEKAVLAVLNEAISSGAVWSNVPESDGRLIRLLTESAGAKNVVEIGTSTGYSGLWFCLALLNTGGRLTTFEIDPGRAATAREHFRKAGVERLVTIVQGDAHENIARLKEPIDVLFIDADKDGYADYLNKLLPLVRPGGLILAHNSGMAPDYVRLVTSNPELDTVFDPGGGEMAITLKKR